MNITKNTTIGEIVSTHPEVVPIIMNKGLHCVGCHVAHWESLEEGCKGHGMTDEQVEELLKEINSAKEEKKD